MTLLPVTSNRKKNSQERVRHERTGFPETGLKFKHQVTSVILSTYRERGQDLISGCTQQNICFCFKRSLNLKDLIFLLEGGANKVRILNY